MSSQPVIKIEVFGEDVEALAHTLVALAAKISAVAESPAPALDVNMGLEDLLAITRQRAAEVGLKVNVLKADADAVEEEETPADTPPETYEPRAVKRRGRRSKAEIEAAEAAAKAAAEAADGEPEAEPEMTLWSDEAEDAEMSEADLEDLKKKTIAKILPIWKGPGGQERIGALLKDYKQYAAIGTIPAKHFPDIARRLGV